MTAPVTSNPDSSNERPMMRLKTAHILLAMIMLAHPTAGSAAQGAAEPAVASPGGGDPLKKGIWIGNLNLCNAGPVTAMASFDSFSGLPVVNITLDATLSDALGELTAANIGKPLPIRVDGKIVSEPNVNEPIRGGQLQISGLNQAEADRIVATLQACPE